MPLKKCQRQGCKARNNAGVWLVDGKAMCANCFEQLLSVSAVDEHRIVRVSDRDDDFSQWGRAATGARAAKA